MPVHEPKLCPRCGAEFECRSGSITRCQCQAVVLPEAVLAAIARRYSDCLCAACLKALRDEYQSKPV